MIHRIRRTKYDNGNLVEPPKNKLNVLEREFKTGDVFSTTNGAMYKVQEDGSARRTNKLKMGKKERRMRRQTIKAAKQTLKQETQDERGDRPNDRE